jgi:tetratricopeptide (TPR) repeat protein
LAVTAVITGSALADNGPLKIALFQQQLTNGAPQVVADALALEAEQNPTSPHIQYNAGVAAYAAHRWEDALVAFDRVETLGHRGLAQLARFQRGNAEYQLGVESKAANLDETLSRWRAALEAYQTILKEHGKFKPKYDEIDNELIFDTTHDHYQKTSSHHPRHHDIKIIIFNIMIYAIMSML